MDDYYDYADDLRGLEAVEGEYVAVTLDEGVLQVTELLRRIKRALGMDVVYISQFIGGVRVVRDVAADAGDAFAFAQGHSDPLEESYCYLVAQARLPQVVPDASRSPRTVGLAATQRWKIGSHVATPVIGADGKIHGTVCCFTHVPVPGLEGSRELAALRSVASLLASKLSRAVG